MDFGGNKLNFIQIGLGTNATFTQNLAGTGAWRMEVFSVHRRHRVQGIGVEHVKEIIDSLSLIHI
mgnify:CR=1 FL=1